MPKHPRGGRPCSPERWREYLNSALHVLRNVLRTGRAWRHLPHDFTVTWSAAHKHFLRWCRAGTWTHILTAIRGEVRTRAGRRRRPSAAVVDSSSVKASPVAGPRGFDGAKKVDGVKRHILVDSSGVLVAALLTPADVAHRAAFHKLGRTAKPIAPTIGHVWLDKGYTGATVRDAAAEAGVSNRRHVRAEIRHRVPGPAAPMGRRTHQRLNRQLPPPRPPLRNHPRCPPGFLILSQIALLLRRLDRSQSFDTL